MGKNMEKKDSFSYGPHTEIFKEHLILSQEVSQVNNSRRAGGLGRRSTGACTAFKSQSPEKGQKISAI